MKDALYNSSTLAKIKRSIRLIESTMADDKPAADECKKTGKDKPLAEAGAAAGELTFPIDVEALNAAHPGRYVLDFEYETEGLDNQDDSVEMFKEALTKLQEYWPEVFANRDLTVEAVGYYTGTYRPALRFCVRGTFGQLMQFCYLYNDGIDPEEMCEYAYDELIKAKPDTPQTATFKV